MPDLSPCRHCGETEHLRIDTSVEEDWTFNDDGSVQRTASGSFAVVEHDYAVCSICNAQAPVEIWNRPDGQWASLRASVLAGWKEHEAAEAVVLAAMKA